MEAGKRLMKKKFNINLSGIFYMMSLISESKIKKVLTSLLETAIQVTSKGMIVEDVDTLYDLLINKFEISVKVTYIIMSFELICTFNDESVEKDTIVIKDISALLSEISGIFSVGYISEDGEKFSIDILKDIIRINYNQTEILVK